MTPRIEIIIGTTRSNRFSEKPAAWLLDRLTRRDDLSVEVVDVRDHPLALFDLDTPPAQSLRR